MRNAIDRKGRVVRGGVIFLGALLSAACGAGPEMVVSTQGEPIAEQESGEREYWNWQWVSTYYHPFEGEKDMGPNTAVCGKIMDLYKDLKYFAVSERGGIWEHLVGGATCDPESFGDCRPGDDCARVWNRIPTGYKSGSLGVDARVRLPNCDRLLDRLCGKRFVIKNPSTGHTTVAYVGDVCPNEHWNNKMTNNCQPGQNVLDLHVDTYQALGGSFKGNIKVHVRPESSGSSSGSEFPPDLSTLSTCSANNGWGFGEVFNCGDGRRCAKTDQTYTFWCLVR